MRRTNNIHHLMIFFPTLNRCQCWTVGSGREWWAACWSWRPTTSCSTPTSRTRWWSSTAARSTAWSAPWPRWCRWRCTTTSRAWSWRTRCRRKSSASWSPSATGPLFSSPVLSCSYFLISFASHFISVLNRSHITILRKTSDLYFL